MDAENWGVMYQANNLRPSVWTRVLVLCSFSWIWGCCAVWGGLTYRVVCGGVCAALLAISVNNILMVLALQRRFERSFRMVCPTEFCPAGWLGNIQGVDMLGKGFQSFKQSEMKHW